MLHTHTVRDELLELLEKISADETFSSFSMVGGTSLALQIGHRYSIDLDFFSVSEFDHLEILEKLQSFGSVIVTNQTKNILNTLIDGLKVDFVNYTLYPFIREPIIEQKIRLASKEDIAAMKLHAISNRGTKKDFIDLYFLLKHFSLIQMIDFYREKYSHHAEFGMLKSITYFHQAENTPEPKVYENFDWENCKEKIRIEYDKLKLL